MKRKLWNVKLLLMPVVKSLAVSEAVIVIMMEMMAQVEMAGQLYREQERKKLAQGNSWLAFLVMKSYKFFISLFVDTIRLEYR
eukprot:m.17764 g.17764  ORF g.17764 m.17764 type:complete len:83 (+) comp27551_c0_seq1:475-723(+)